MKNLKFFSTSRWLLCLLLLMTIATNEVAAQKKKSAAQLNAEREIDNKRSEVGLLRSNIAAKTAEINQKQSIFDARRAEHAAEEERIAAKDAAVKDRESCLSNLLADVLPLFATDVINDYTRFRNSGDRSKIITRFAFAPKMMDALTPAYKLAHKEHLSTFIETTDRMAFAAIAEEKFDLYFLGGLDKSGDTLEGIFSDHFHPKNLPADSEIAQPLADKYIKNLKSLYVADESLIALATEMPIEFYVGWDKFVNECSMVVVQTMKDKRRKNRVPEVEAQTKFAAELRTEYLHLEDLKQQRKEMESDLYILQSNLEFLENNYFKLYKVKY
jgi:hypothetical protein